MADLDYNALGQAIDTTWGRSSTPVINSFSVKMTMVGPDTIKLVYQTVINFASERQMLQTKLREKELSDSNVKSVLDGVKNSYKQLTTNTLKTKEIGSEESLEIVGLAVHNPKKTALYRRVIMLEVG